MKNQKTFNLIRLIIFVLILFGVVASYRYIKTDFIGYAASNNMIKNLKGLDLITDENFKQQMLLILNTIVKRDFKTEYNYLSKSVIKNHCPKVKNADDFIKFMKGISYYPDGAGFAEFNEVTKFKIISKQNYQVGFNIKNVSEGTLFDDRATYFFVFEDDKWKIDNLIF